MINFGIGAVLLNPLAGNLPANPTPHQGQTIQDFSLDIDQKLVSLMGQYKFPDDVAPSDMSIKGKFQIGRQDYDMFNNTIFADNRAVGGMIGVYNETHPIPTTPFSVTVTGSATFLTDLGVIYVGAPPAGNTQALMRVTGTPTTGQYAVSAGVYTFAAADTGLSIAISYTQTNTTTGFVVSVNNQLQGYGPVFSVTFLEKYTLASSASGSPGVIYLPQCRFSKLNQDFKRNEYVKPQMEFEAFPNAAGLAIQFINPGTA